VVAGLAGELFVLSCYDSCYQSVHISTLHTDKLVFQSIVTFSVKIYAFTPFG
jgi:hypothetical protein